MKILIISFGKDTSRELAGAIDDFSLRISRWAPLEWRVLSASRDEGEEGRKDEATALLRAISDDDTLVALDERGKKMTSEGFSAFFDRMMSAGEKRIVFAIGGSHGFHPQAIARADLVLSLSDMTMPHQVVRLVLAEQIYRALSILKGSKYHHA